jgi:HD-GYP domain-containing protein (c-di-GMP phosphodiesterase class II)
MENQSRYFINSETEYNNFILNLSVIDKIDTEISKHIIGDEVKELFSIIENFDDNLALHQLRTAFLAYEIGLELDLDEKNCREIYSAALLSNIGEIFIPHEIKNKPGILNADECKIVKRHPKSGFCILHQVGFSTEIKDMVLQHHERMDGTGYPMGLLKNQICMGARIIGLADTFMAMPFLRPYRKILRIFDALKEIKNKTGILFDKKIVTALFNVIVMNGIIKKSPDNRHTNDKINYLNSNRLYTII